MESTSRPAWVEKWSKERTDFERLSQQLEYMLSSPDETTGTALLPVLEEVLARCRNQRALEENVDAFKSLAGERPDLSGRISQLSTERGALQSELIELLGRAQHEARPGNLSASIVSRVQHWLVRMREHLQRVTEVLKAQYPATPTQAQ